MVTQRRLMLTFDRSIEASPEAVWDVLTDVGEWPRWGPSIARAQLDDGRSVLTAGATGRVGTAVGVSLPFVVTEFVWGRRWAWTVAGVPATRHQVDEVDTGTRVSFAVPWWTAPYVTVCALALRNIERIVTERASY
jgi:uncharacterized protein YndB with AHSA1/START domain